MLQLRPNRTLIPFTTALGTALLLSACASSSKSVTVGTGTTDSTQIALSACMRAHGVKNFPDPKMGPYGSAGMSVVMSPGSPGVTVEGIPFSGPVFQDAMKACKFFGGRSAPPPITEALKQKLLAFAQCMRKHGVPKYQDPTFPPGGGVQGGDAGGINRNSPEVQKAANTCSSQSG